MSDETTFIHPPKGDSKIFNVSLRGLGFLIVITTVCAMSVFEIEIKEPLYTVVGAIIGFYYAQHEKPKSQKQ